MTLIVIAVKNFANDVDAIFDLLLSDDKRWRQTDGLAVSGLGQQASIPQSKAHVVCRNT